MKIQQIELGSNGPVLSLVNTANTNGDSAHATIPTPEVEAEVTATDMMLVHNIDKLLEEAEEDDNSIDSLNGLQAGDIQIDNSNGQLGNQLLTHIHLHLLTHLPELETKATDETGTNGPRPTGGDYYIFWDHRHCPVYRNENLCEIHANIVYLGIPPSLTPFLPPSLTHSLTHIN